MDNEDNDDAGSGAMWLDVKWVLDPVDKTKVKTMQVPEDTAEALSELDNLWHGEKVGVAACRDALKSSSRYVLRKTVPIQEVYDIGKQLGKPGTYGAVREAKLLNPENEQDTVTFAVKIINKWKFKNTELTNSFFCDLRNEVRLMWKSHDHPSIIEIRDVFESIDNLYIVMTSCYGGELFERIQADDGFNEDKASKIFAQMLSAVFYIHQLGIMHCDLKPENFIFLDTNSDLIKLIDFGMAKVVRWREYYKRMNGTPYYIAPEVLVGKYNKACDMWSMGVILFILVYGYPPFFDPSNNTNKKESYKVIYRKIRNGFQPKVKEGYGAWFPKDIPVSNEYKDLIARLLRENVASRMTAEEALAHPWITGNCMGERNTPIPMIRSLRHFRRTCGLQSEILRVLCECKFLNRDQEASVKETFARFDKNGDGVISVEELYEAMSEVDSKATMEDARDVIRAVDINANDHLELDEFLGARICRKINLKEERLKKLFRCLDLDDSGNLNAKEIVAALESIRGSSMSLEEAENLINQVDKNKDGVIDYEEFLEMFNAKLDDDVQE